MHRAALAAALALAFMPALAAEMRPSAMEWWQVCAEHGRHVRSKRETPTERDKLIAYWAKGYGFRLGDEHAVLTRQPRFGMSRCTAIAAYGRPADVNRTVTASGEREQWVYDRQRGRLYLYFTNGQLDAFQD